MKTFLIVLLIVILILAVVAIALYFLGKKAKKKQAEQEEAMEGAKQTVSMLIIDKKRMKLKDAGLPAVVLENTPKLLRGQKVPVVKAKVGPQIATLVADEKVFDKIPVKKEVKAIVAGIYIMDVKGIRGSVVSNAAPEKKSKFAQFKEKLQEKAGAKPLK